MIISLIYLYREHMSHRHSPKMAEMVNNPTERRAYVNARCSLITEAENQTLFQLLGPKCVTLASAVVQVFVASAASQGRWSEKTTGIACLVKDSNLRSYFIRIYNLSNGRKDWEQDLIYQRFHYVSNKDPLFHFFDAEEGFACLNFVDEREASNFKCVVKEKLDMRILASSHQQQPQQPQQWQPRQLTGIQNELVESLLSCRSAAASDCRPQSATAAVPHIPHPQSNTQSNCASRHTPHSKDGNDAPSPSLECGHLCCFECAEMIQNCHICRRPITTRKKVYI